MRVKICGITKPEQGRAIADLGATALGFICVRQSSRYVEPSQIKAIIEQLPSGIDRIGVFANADRDEICQIANQTQLTGVQLHGDESPEFCQQLRRQLPRIEIIKAFRIKDFESLSATQAYCDRVDTLLLDAYHPQALGGTGKTLDWHSLANFSFSSAWFLSGGLNPENVTQALQQLKPNGIDLSSGVERAPGDKDLEKVACLFEKINR
jgi:phosphoribosylanthranilate isomerase